MKAACSRCGTQHMLKDADLGDHAKVQFRCTKCGQNTIIEIRRKVDSTQVISPLPSFARSEGLHSSLLLQDDYEGLSLPQGGKFVLRVLSGPSQGRVFE